MMLEARTTLMTHPENRRERKKRELRTRIYEVARGLFLEHGYENTTVEQIADEVDVAQATFFNHFQNKAVLLTQLAQEVAEHGETIARNQILRFSSAQERILGFASDSAEEIEGANELARGTLLELMRTSARPDEAAPYLSRIHAAFVDILREGQANGEVRTDEDAGLIADVVLGALNMSITKWLDDAEYPLLQRLRKSAVFVGEIIKPRT